QLMDPMDRAAMQRQKRMIKNRESAARSRERKQVGGTNSLRSTAFTYFYTKIESSFWPCEFDGVVWR
uniref:BZIP domain-containing protein n=1 Tax=Aegilops tauschii subsp. strangulata TaxID=200361 RepID=A0A453G071_AEGTS